MLYSLLEKFKARDVDQNKKLGGSPVFSNEVWDINLKKPLTDEFYPYIII